MSYQKYNLGTGQPAALRTPLCERTGLTEESRAHLLTMDALLARSSGTIQDSIWAPTHARIPPRIPLSQRTNIKIEQNSPVKAEKQIYSAQESRFQKQETGLSGSRWCDIPSKNGLPASNSARRRMPDHSSADNNIPPHTRGPDNQIELPTFRQGFSSSVIRDPGILNLSKPDKATYLPFAVSGEEHLPPRLRGLRVKEEAAEAGSVQLHNYQAADEPSSLTNDSVDRSSGGVPVWEDSAQQTQRKHSQFGTAGQPESPMHHQFGVKTIGPVTPYGRSASNNLMRNPALVSKLQIDEFLKYIASQAANQSHVAKKYTAMLSNTAHNLQQVTPSSAVSFNSRELTTFNNRPRPAMNDTTPQQPKYHNSMQFLGASDSAYLRNEPAWAENHKQLLPGIRESDRPIRTVNQKPSNPRNYSFNSSTHNNASASSMDPKIARKEPEVTVPDKQPVDGWVKKALPIGRNLVTSIYAELREQSMLPPASTKLTQNAIVEKTGSRTRDGIVTFDDKISDARIQERPNEIVQWTQGRDARDELAELSECFMPAPCDWEIDRRALDRSYIPEYIQEWQKSGLPCGSPYTLDMSSDAFKFGTRPVHNFSLGDPVIAPDCIPDIANSENEKKRLHQTALIDATNMLRKWELREKRDALLQKQADAYYQEIEQREPEVDPFDPKIPCYFRPASQQDINQIAGVYNYYVKNENVTEDQKPLSNEDIRNLMAYCKKEKLPIIVGVKGGNPEELQGFSVRKTRPTKLVMPKGEVVVGFAFTEIWNYGVSGTRHGRSRNTVNLQFYVHHEYTRKGIGRNLLDHTMYIMHRGSTWRNKTTFINPNNDPAYGQGGGGHWHQFLVQYPVLRKDDPNYEWFKKFLQNLFWFEEETRLRAVGRTSVHQGKVAQWMDLVIFQIEAHSQIEFGFEPDA